MKRLSFFLPLLILSSGCRLMGACLDKEQCANDDKPRDNTGQATGGEKCKGLPMQGSWKREGVDETLNFGKDCIVKRSKCSLSGSYAAPTTAETKEAPGAFALKWVEQRVPQGDTTCPPLGDYACAFRRSDTDLTLTCKNTKGDLGINARYITTD